MDIIEVGEALYCLNKEAKNIRDTIYYEKGDLGGWSFPGSEKYKEQTKKTLGLSDEEYRIREPYEIIPTLEKEKNKLYNLKNKVINKALNSGIKPLGYHVFVTENRYGDKYYNECGYIEIGKRGFHIPVKFTYGLKDLGNIFGGVESDYNVTFTDEMKKILEEYIEQ